jgi:hypothetical protein
MNSKMRFKLLNFVRKLFLMLLKRHTPPLLWKIYLYENFSFIPHYISTQTIYIYKKIHDMNGFLKLRAVSKLSTFF